MIIIFALLAVATFTAYNPNELDVRTGISQFQLGNLTHANYTIVFKSALPDSNYNSLVSLSYVSKLDISNGIDFISVCQDKNQTSLICSIKSNNSNQFSIIYMSYVISDYSSLLVGSQSITFNLNNITSMSKTVQLDIHPSKDYINSTNGLYINLYSFVAGLSSLDPDFQLSLSNSRFDGLTALASIDITISEINVKNITIIFGYILYDVRKAKIGFYEGERLRPGSIALGYIYGITNIKRDTTSGSTTKTPIPPPKKRLLQISQGIGLKQKEETLITPPEGLSRQIYANQLFDQLFSTNGFMITTTLDDIDQMFYYQVIPMSNLIRTL